MKTSHHAKFTAKSPSFNETNIDARFWRDETEVALDVKVDHAEDRYKLLIKQTDRVESKRSLITELDVRDKKFSMRADLHTAERKELKIEVHIDK